MCVSDEVIGREAVGSISFQGAWVCAVKVCGSRHTGARGVCVTMCAYGAKFLKSLLETSPFTSKSERARERE